MTVRLQLLGTPRLVYPDGVQNIPSNKPSSLLLYLAYRADWASRSELAFLYRSEHSEVAALGYLRKLIYRAKRYPWAEGLEVSDSQLRWLVDSDVKAMRQAMQAKDWQGVIDLYQGELLTGVELGDSQAYSAWRDSEREDVARQWRQAMWQRIQQLEAETQPGEALELIKLLRKEDPFDEEQLQLQLRLLVTDKRPQEALQLYAQFCQLLAAEVGAEPLESTQAFIDSLKDQAFTLSTPQQHNLPAQTTSFVGRQFELTSLAKKLRDKNCRLLTLVGLGGTGKTRLALELARQQHESYRDGVYFVSLAGVRVAEAMIPSIAEQLGMSLLGSVTPYEQLVDYLQAKHLLLILDNLEQLKAHTNILERLLKQCPQLTLVVTSREALELDSEWLIDVGGLTYPDQTGVPDDNLDAVKLFIQRATRVASSFVVTPDNLTAIAAICRMVEGMPLAIELAASWLRSLSVQQLLAELEDNVSILAETSRANERSTNSIFDYVWQRLDSQEQEALVKLAVFQGGFSLDAAKAVAGAHLTLLMRLINRSLVTRQTSGRYHMHALIRQYCLLKQTSDHQASHAHYFLAMLAASEQDIQGKKQQTAIATLDADYDNILQAWRVALKEADTAALAQGLESLYYYFYFKGYFHLAIDTFSMTVDRLSDDSHLLKAKLLTRQALFQRNLGDMAAAEHTIKEALAHLALAPDEAETCIALCERGKIAHNLSRYDEAEQLYHRALLLAQRVPNAYIEATCLMALGDLVYYMEGDIEASEANYQASLVIFKRLGEQDGINAALLNLGAAAYNRKDFMRAQHYVEEAYKIIASLGQTHREAIVLCNLAMIYESQGDLDKADEHYHKGLALRWQSNDKRGAATTLNYLAKLALQRHNYQEACDKHREALSLFIELSDQSGIAFTQSHYARALFACGQQEQADYISQQALTLAWSIGNQTDILSSLLTAAMLHRDPQQGTNIALVVQHEARQNHEIIRQEAERWLASQGVNKTAMPAAALSLETIVTELLS